jgi:hypothetical protein
MDWTRTIAQVSSLLDSQQGLKSHFTWQGKPCWGVRTTLKRDYVAMDAGLAGSYSYSLLVPADLLEGMLPQPRVDKLTVDGIPMRVLSLEHDSVHATVRLHLGDVLE